MNIMFGNESIENTCSELKFGSMDNMEQAINKMSVLNFFGLENLMAISETTEIEKLYKLIESPGCENVDDYPINVYDPEFISGVEGVVWDTISTTYKGVKGGVKMVHKAHKAAYRQINNMKLNWNQNIKPLIIKILKEFQTQLQIMWGKFRKYDELYVKLGKEINSVINVYGKQVETLPSITLYYHKFNGRMLRGFAEVIASYEAFMGAVKGAPDLFNGNFVEPKDFAEIIKSGDTTKAKNAVDNMSQGMQKLNERGDLSIAFAMMNDVGKNTDNGAWAKIKNFFVGEDNDRILRVAIKNKTPLVQFVQIAILRNEVEKAYNTSNISQFKADLLDRNDSYLQVLSSILNRRVLQKVLERGASTIKKQTQEDISNMETLVNAAQTELNKRQKNDNLNSSNKNQNEKDENTRQRNDVTGNNKSGGLAEEAKNASDTTNNMKNGGPESAPMDLYSYFFGTEADTSEFFEKQTDTSAKAKDDPSDTKDPSNTTSGGNDSDGTGAMQMPELVAAYCQTYSIFMSKCTSGYSSIVKAVLAATFTLCKEADTIVNTIYDAAGAKRDEATKGYINNDNNEDNK